MSEPLFYPGFQEAKDSIRKMNEKELLDYIDGLWGREALPEDYTLEDLRYEAFEQCRKEFRTPEGTAQNKQWSDYAKAMKSMMKDKPQIDESYLKEVRKMVRELLLKKGKTKKNDLFPKTQAKVEEFKDIIKKSLQELMDTLAEDKYQANSKTIEETIDKIEELIQELTRFNKTLEKLL